MLVRGWLAGCSKGLREKAGQNGGAKGLREKKRPQATRKQKCPHTAMATNNTDCVSCKTPKKANDPTLQQDINNAARFTAGLLAVLFAVILAWHLSQHITIPFPPSFVPALSYVYIVSYALVSGMLAYLGIDFYENLYKHYIHSPKLRDLVSVSTVGIFSLTLAMFIKKTIARLTKRELVITAESMLAGYILMRSLLIGTMALLDPK